MPRTNYLILVLLLVFNCNNKERREQSPVVTVSLKYYGNGNLKYEVELADTVPHGIFKEYYSNGQIKTKGRYVNGKLDGTALCYYLDEKIKCVELYSNNLLNGESIYYYDNGNVEYKGKFYDGKKVGVHYEYFKERNDAIKSRMEYVIVGSKNLLNSMTEYSIEGMTVKQTTNLKTTKNQNELIIEVREKEFDDIAVVICDYDLLFNLDSLNSCDTTYSQNRHSISIPFNVGDTVRGIIVNYEWISDNQTVSKDIYFIYPNPW